jgi:hypothetical protein
MGLLITADRIAMIKWKWKRIGSHINDLVNADASPAGTEVQIKIPVNMIRSFL